MTTVFLIAFLVSLVGMAGLGVYGLHHFIKEMISEKAWGWLAFTVCLLIFAASNIALHMIGILPEPTP